MGTSGKKTNVVTFDMKVQALKKGFDSFSLPKGMQLVVDGQVMTLPAVDQQLTTIVDDNAAVETKKQDYQDAVASRRAAMPTRTSFVSKLEAGLITLLGRDSPQLRDFGIPPPKPKTPRSAASKAMSAALGISKKQQNKAKIAAALAEPQGQHLGVGPDGTLIPAANAAPAAPEASPVAPATPATPGK
jgi:hypothetical protein